MRAIIAAVDEKYGIGKDGTIPWRYREDFKWFKAMTNNSVCVMGRKTFDDIVEISRGKPVLPYRACLVLTSEPIPEDIQFTGGPVPSLEALDDILKDYEGNLFFIGGVSIFEAALDRCDHLFLTRIPKDYECDTHFPHQSLTGINTQDQLFKLVQTLTIDSENGLVVEVYDRTQGVDR